jgi:YbbR domain-containing protein
MIRIAARLLDHWQLKLLSLVFAVALWVIVAVEDIGEVVYTVPLDLTHLPPGLQVAVLGAETVDVRLHGLRHVLSRIEERALRARVSLRGARPGDLVLLIRPEDVPVPRGVQVVRVTPSQIHATLEPTAGKPRP